VKQIRRRWVVDKEFCHRESLISIKRYSVLQVESQQQKQAERYFKRAIAQDSGEMLEGIAHSEGGDAVINITRLRDLGS
jgi:hypothetical protein